MCVCVRLRVNTFVRERCPVVGDGYLCVADDENSLLVGFSCLDPPEVARVVAASAHSK